MTELSLKQRNRIYNKRWNEKNKDRLTEYRKLYYLNHKEEIKEKNKNWTNNNKEKLRDYQRRYVKTHPEQIKKNIQRRAEKRDLKNIEKRQNTPINLRARYMRLSQDTVLIKKHRQEVEEETNKRLAKYQNKELTFERLMKILLKK
jgi:hypothetical protein